MVCPTMKLFALLVLLLLPLASSRDLASSSDAPSMVPSMMPSNAQPAMQGGATPTPSTPSAPSSNVDVPSMMPSKMMIDHPSLVPSLLPSGSPVVPPTSAPFKPVAPSPKTSSATSYVVSVYVVSLVVPVAYLLGSLMI